MPKQCICGRDNNVDHALSCSSGGFPSLRHNEIRDMTAEMMSTVTSCVGVEPELQPLSGEVLTQKTANRQDGARLDVRSMGFWERSQAAFFDVRVFNPLAATNRNHSLESLYKKNEKEKRNAYEQRVREIEHGSFTPLVFSATGGMGPAAKTTYSRLAALIADKNEQPYSKTINLIRCKINFSLLRSAIRCIRGSRSSRGRPSFAVSPLNLISAEGNIPLF